MIKAFIFDLDGVLINTETLSDHHITSYLTERFQITITTNHLDLFRGTTAQATWGKIKREFNIPDPLEIIIEDYRKSYLTFLESTTHLEAAPGVISLIKILKKNKLKIALASSAYRKRLTFLLKVCKLDPLFKTRVSGDDILNSKPAPDIFLQAAHLLRCPPNTCVAIEDSTNGILSAKRAGMTVIAFRGFTKTQDVSLADIVINDFNKATIISLLKKLGIKI